MKSLRPLFLLSLTLLSSRLACATMQELEGVTLFDHPIVVGGQAQATEFDFANSTDSGLSASNGVVIKSSGVPIASFMYGLAESPVGISTRVYIGGLPLMTSLGTPASSPADRLTVYGTSDGTGSTNVESNDVYSINLGTGSARFLAYGSYATSPHVSILGAWGSNKSGRYYTGGPLLASSSFIEAQLPANFVLRNMSLATYFVNDTTPVSSETWDFIAKDSSTLDGTEVGHLSPAGCYFLGSNTNATIPAGNAGEYKPSTATAVLATTTGQWKDAASFAITAGNWLVTVSGFAVTGATTNSDFVIGFSTTTGNSGVGMTYGVSKNASSFPATSGYDAPCSVTGLMSLPASFSGTLYLKYLADYTGTAPSFTGALQAWRMP